MSANIAHLQSASNSKLQKALGKISETGVFCRTAKLVGSLAVEKSDLDDEVFSPFFMQLLRNVHAEQLSLTELIMLRQAAEAIENGDTRAAEFIRDTSGEKPSEKRTYLPEGVSITNLPDDVLEELLQNLG